MEKEHFHENSFDYPGCLFTVLAGFVPFREFVSSDGHATWNLILILCFLLLLLLSALIGIFLAMWLYKKQMTRPQKLLQSLGWLYQAAYQKFYIDEIYLFITKKIIFNLIGRPAAWIDKNIVDGLMNDWQHQQQKFPDLIKGFNRVKCRTMPLYFFGGIVGLAVVFLYLWK